MLIPCKIQCGSQLFWGLKTHRSKKNWHRCRRSCQWRNLLERERNSNLEPQKIINQKSGDMRKNMMAKWTLSRTFWRLKYSWLMKELPTLSMQLHLMAPQQTFHTHFRLAETYCWRKKSGVYQLRWDMVVFPIMYRVLYIPGGCLGFHPSTVVPSSLSLVSTLPGA